MAKKLANKRVARKRRASKAVGLATRKAAARPAGLHEWLDSVRTFATFQVKAGAEIGGCLVTDPAGGADMCISTDRTTCTLMKGTFTGGPC
jgi:hypothetical protein